MARAAEFKSKSAKMSNQKSLYLIFGLLLVGVANGQALEAVDEEEQESIPLSEVDVGESDIEQMEYPVRFKRDIPQKRSTIGRMGDGDLAEWTHDLSTAAGHEKKYMLVKKKPKHKKIKMEIYKPKMKYKKIKMKVPVKKMKKKKVKGYLVKKEHGHEHEMY